MISIQNITYNYPGSKHLVFKDFSLNLAPGRIYGLLGKNGTGKSTLLYLVCGLLRQRKGTVTLNGEPCALRKPDMLQDIYLVPEEYDLPNVSLKDYVRSNSLFYPRFSEATLNSCLADFELPTDIHLKSLSMGQKKKVFMSFAMATGCSYIFMDEPTNGLDIPSKSLFRKVVARHMTDDRTLIVATHQVHDVESLLDHIVIIDQSHVLLNSSVSAITEAYVFRTIAESEAAQAVYTEPCAGGLSAMVHRKADEEETQLNLELLFDAAVSGSLPRTFPPAQ